MKKVLGRVTLFVKNKKENANAPDFDGYVQMDDGTKLEIDLWKRPARTEAGYMFTGRIGEALDKEQQGDN